MEASVSPDLSPQERAADVTRRGASNLWYVGRALSPAKRRFFEAAYATMRVIDDFVDDTFLALSPADRADARQAARARVLAWRRAAKAAVRGEEPPPTGVALDDSVLTALAQAAVGGNVPAQPWLALSDAMLFDIEESPLESWADFEAYCEGATVAPAAVFLFVLQVSPDEPSRVDLDASALFDQARDMAIFCYLVHIARDFAKDAARGGQLVTIPAAAFAKHGTTRAAAERDPTAARPVIRDLLAIAAERGRAARTVADALIPKLDEREGRILDTLLSIYERLHDDLVARPDPLSADGAGLTARLRNLLADRLGLD